MKLKKGDTVLIISGKDKGKRGKVLQVMPREFKIVAEGVNIKKKHRRARKSGEKGQVVSFPAPIPQSKAMIICPKCNQPTKVMAKILEGRKYRSCKKCHSEFE